MSLESAFAPAENAYRNKVLQSAWGHAAPKKNKTYRGYIVFSTSAYGGAIEIIDADWGDLEDSPWLYDAMYDLVCDHAPARGAVRRFDGTFKNFKFDGAISDIYKPKE